MNPILHALYAKPVGSEFMRQRGRVHTSECDRDLLNFDECGNIVLDRSGLPLMRGVKSEPELRKRAITFERKYRYEIAILKQLNKQSNLTPNELAVKTGFSIVTVKSRLGRFVELGLIVECGEKKLWTRFVMAYSIADAYKGLSYAEVLERISHKARHE